MKTMGALPPKIIDAVLEALPMDITIIDREDRVIAWNESRVLFDIGDEVMGGDVRSCHPPKSIPVLDRMLSDMREGRLETTRSVMEVTRDGERRRFMVHYIALRDREGNYLGCMEVDTDLTGIPEPRAGGY